MRKEAMAESVVDAARVELDKDASYSNIFERYSIRPQSMQNIALYEFASIWEDDYKKAIKHLTETAMTSMQNWITPPSELKRLL